MIVLLSAIIVGLILRRIKFTGFFLILSSLFAYGFCISGARFFLYYESLGFSKMPIARQAISFALGGLVFLGLKESFRVSTDKVMRCILFSSIPFLFFGIYQRLTGFLAPFYPRIQGLFYEPSYYGDYLTLILAPTLCYQLINLKNNTNYTKAFIFLVSTLLLLNLLFVESGTAILKFLSFFIIATAFYPMSLKNKLYVTILASVFLIGIMFMFGGYVLKIWSLAIEVASEPNKFFKYHTFYDRFYPLYPALKNLLSFEGFFGLGFGGDYYEFTNLYPASTHKEMIATKPSLSYFNSFASKIILYLGFPGLIWYLSLYKKCLRINKYIVKIGLLNVLISSLWGVANFSLPYLWFWLALTKIEDEEYG